MPLYYCHAISDYEAEVNIRECITRFRSKVSSPKRQIISPITDCMDNAYRNLKIFRSHTGLQSKILRRVCIDKFKVIFADRISDPCAIGKAYKYLSLIKLGIPTELETENNVLITLFCKAVEVNYPKEREAIRIITKGIANKNLEDMVYGFMLFHFSKSKSSIANDLRKQAIEIFK